MRTLSSRLIPLLTLTSTLFFAAACDEKMSDIVGGDDQGYKAPQEEDADGDGVLDAWEGTGDVDGDGVPNYLDTDADGDCIPDRVEYGASGYEAPLDSDLDGVFDFLDTDSDNNGILDNLEAGDCDRPSDLDADGVGNYADLDDDGDTISDLEEGWADPDRDGTGNYRDLDSDGDCLPDSEEAGDSDLDTSARDTDGDGSPDFLDIDSDGDGLGDTNEVEGACDPVLDTDRDGLSDYLDPDIDGDGLTNEEEGIWGTDPMVRDSDADGATDGLEVFAGTRPMEVADFPSGIIIETGPRQVTEATREYVVDTNKVDIFVLLDTAYNYSCYHPDLPSFIEDLVNAVYLSYEDVAIGFGTYDDYTYQSNWAAAGGKPYYMNHQISTDQTSVKEAARGVSMVYGGDSYGSAYEGLYQAMTGLGYDQESDRSFDSSDDIRPYMSDSSDAFHGGASGSYDSDVEGTGDIAGVGWRAGSKQVVIVTADNVIRDGDMGHEVPAGTTFDPATYSTAVASVNAQRTKTLGINVYEYQTSDSTLQNQLIAIATGTNSYIDLDDDGINDDPAVLYGSWNWPPIEDVVEALHELAEELLSIDLWFEIGEDELGWITELDPDGIQWGLEDGAVVTLYLEVTTSAPTLPDDQFYWAQIKVLTEEGQLAEYDVWLVIRPETT